MHKKSMTKRIHQSLRSPLPFKDSVVFVDWHGVLSSRRFWEDTLSDPKHLLFEDAMSAHQRIFAESPDISMAWMKGLLSDTEVIELVASKRGVDIRQQLHTSLLSSLKGISLSKKVAAMLEDLRADRFVVIATDNTESSVAEIESSPLICAVVDDIISSSRVGVLKSESIYEFFSPWLVAHNLTFDRAILLDDSSVNCRAFSAAGGLSILINNPNQVCDALESCLGSLSTNFMSQPSNFGEGSPLQSV